MIGAALVSVPRVQSSEVHQIRATQSYPNDLSLNQRVYEATVPSGSNETGLGALPEEIPEGARIRPVYEAGVLPTHFDWRQQDGYNWMTPVKNQGSCGSCVAFGAVGALEGQLRIQANNPSWNADLSEQHLFSCGGGSCGTGWYVSSALNYLEQYGTPDEACSPYRGTDTACSSSCPDWQSRAFNISSWSWLDVNPNSIEAALLNGPLVARFDVYSDFYAYVSGIYHHTSGALRGGHAVTIVGYDSIERYWIVKNSWGTGWGEKGYFRIGFGEVGIDRSVASIRASVRAPPSVNLNAPQIDGLTVTINGAAQPGTPGTSVTKITWDWGDGTIEDASLPATHIYGAGGIYSVTTLVFQSDGLSTKKVQVLTAPSSEAPAGQSFFHPASEFWFSTYDMKNAGWDAIHIVNTGTQTATVQIYIGGVSMEATPISIPANESVHREYPGVEGGPAHVVGDQPLWVTQRVLGWGAFQEIQGSPTDVASTQLIWTWYDSNGAQTDDIYVVNPSDSSTAHVTVYIAGIQQGSMLAVGPGQNAKTSYQGVVGGPVRVFSDIPVLGSQRVIGWNDFAEIIGLPTWYTFKESWFNWYDMQGADWDAIHMLNPGITEANVQIYINGVLKDTLTIPTDGADYRTFPGVVGGPVHVVSDQPIWVTQRIIGWGGWKEVFGVPVDLMRTKWYFTWYDMKDAQWDAIHFLNPGTSEANVTVTIAGTVFGTYTVPAGGSYNIHFPGLCGGPIVIESDVPIMATQRILGWDSFEETLGAQWT
jgi:PKD repeat protein